jgi:hypothetical protein
LATPEDIHEQLRRLGLERNVERYRSEIVVLAKQLMHDEFLTFLTAGRDTEGTGILVATDRRALFVGVGKASSWFEEFPYDAISSVRVERGEGLSRLVVTLPGKQAMVDWLNPASAETFVKVVGTLSGIRARPVVTLVTTAERALDRPWGTAGGQGAGDERDGEGELRRAA